MSTAASDIVDLHLIVVLCIPCDVMSAHLQVLQVARVTTIGTDVVDVGFACYTYNEFEIRIHAALSS